MPDLFDRVIMEIIVIFTIRIDAKKFQPPHAANRGALNRTGAVAFDLHVQSPQNGGFHFSTGAIRVVLAAGNRRGQAFLLWGRFFCPLIAFANSCSHDTLTSN